MSVYILICIAVYLPVPLSISLTMIDGLRLMGQRRHRIGKDEDVDRGLIA
jgi:hypothetical protein